jgi:hypothetical protein
MLVVVVVALLTAIQRALVALVVAGTALAPLVRLRVLELLIGAVVAGVKVALQRSDRLALVEQVGRVWLYSSM